MTIIRDRQVPPRNTEPQAIIWSRYFASYPTQSAPFIHEVLDTTWHSVYDFNGSDDQKLGELNPLRRTLSERALCSASYTLMSIFKREHSQGKLPADAPVWPEGFEHTSGTVTARIPQTDEVIEYTVSETGTAIREEDVYHEYFRRLEHDGSETIWCLTGAQFTYPADGIEEPGQRMTTLEMRATAAGRPDLFTRIDDQIGVIYGKADDIERILGLTYESAGKRRARL